MGRIGRVGTANGSPRAHFGSGGGGGGIGGGGGGIGGGIGAITDESTPVSRGGGIGAIVTSGPVSCIRASGIGVRTSAPASWGVGTSAAPVSRAIGGGGIGASGVIGVGGASIPLSGTIGTGIGAGQPGTSATVLRAKPAEANSGARGRGVK